MKNIRENSFIRGQSFIICTVSSKARRLHGKQAQIDRNRTAKMCVVKYIVDCGILSIHYRRPGVIAGQAGCDLNSHR